MAKILSRLARTRPSVGAWPLVVRTAAGAVFVGFSLGKFLRHEAERGAFERYEVVEEPPTKPSKARRHDRTLDLLAAIADSENGALRSSALGHALGLASPASTNRWITRASERGYIEPTTENPFDPSRAYRLTPAGRATHEAERQRQQ